MEPKHFYLLSCGEHDFQNHGIYDSQAKAQLEAIDFEKSSDIAGLHWQVEVYYINTNEPIETISFMVSDAWKDVGE